MTKREFLTRLETGLKGLPQEDISERLAFYAEMIDDRMEEGLSEEEAVAEIGSVEEVVSRIVSETPLSGLIKERMKPKRRLTGLEISLIVLGFPVWLPLFMAAFVVLFSVYVVLWSLVVCLWAVGLSFAVSALACIVFGILSFGNGNPVRGGLLLCGAAVLAGVSILLFLGCSESTKGAAVLTKKIARGIKSLFIGKEKNA